MPPNDCQILAEMFDVRINLFEIVVQEDQAKNFSQVWTSGNNNPNTWGRKIIQKLKSPFIRICIGLYGLEKRKLQKIHVLRDHPT